MTHPETETPPALPGESQFRESITLRNRGLISEDDQRRLADATILIAGCGSTGGAAVEPMVRASAQCLLLAEPGTYELNNLNRQRASMAAVGHNKADWLAQTALEINPWVQIETFCEGITPRNARYLCERASLIVDGVDVTSREGLTAKLALHSAAAAAKRPVVCAYDLAYRQYIRVYDYRKDGAQSLDGKSQAIKSAAETSPLKALSILIPFTVIPFDLIGEIERLLKEPGASISQLGCTADLFGAVIVPLTIELLARRPIRRQFQIDIKDAVLPADRRWPRNLITQIALARLVLSLIRMQTGGAG